MARLVAVCLLGIPIWLSQFVRAQSAPTSDPQAVAYATQSMAAMTGGALVSDVSIAANATWTVGSSVQAGTAVLAAKGANESRVDLTLRGGKRSEIRNSLGGMWAGTDGVYHDIALHNCWTDASWFFPALGSLAAAASNPKIILSSVAVDGASPNLRHLRAQTYDTSPLNVQQLSVTDFYLDSKTLLPQVVTFNEHPDDNPNVNIGVEVMFSDYRNVNGVMVPYHVQRYVNNTLTLDFQLTSISFNSGIPDNQFSAQ